MITGEAAPLLDMQRLIAVLGAAQVEFVMVGSSAAWVHGASRRPNDLDVVVRDDWKNFEAVADALRRVHARPRVPGLTDEEARTLPTRVDAAIVAELPISVWLTDAGELDLFDALSHNKLGERTYAQLLEASTTRRISGVTTPIASVDDLLGAKRFADRDIDRADVSELGKILEVQTRNRAPSIPPVDRRPGLDL